MALRWFEVRTVRDDHFAVEDAKTAAGVRAVPIHREVQQTLTRLVQTSEDGYVLSGLGTNKYGKRSTNLVKQFSNL